MVLIIMLYSTTGGRAHTQIFYAKSQKANATMLETVYPSHPNPRSFLCFRAPNNKNIKMLCNAMPCYADVNAVLRCERKSINLRALLRATLDSGGPGRKISLEGSEGEGAIAVLGELAVGLASALVDFDNGVAVVEVTTSLGGDLEGGGVGLGDLSVVLLEAGTEGVGEVVASIIASDRSVRVRDITLHAAGDERNAGSLNHGDGGQDSESSGSELHIGGWLV